LEKLYHTHYDRGADVPPASECDLATMDVSDPEL